MRALDKKLFRDISRLRGQVLTIALVVAAGVTSHIALKGAWLGMVEARDTYYDRAGFGDVFVGLRRAPRSLLERLETIDGVAAVEGRVVHPLTFSFEASDEPLPGVAVGLPAGGGQGRFNRLVLRSGRWPEPRRGTEVIVLESFANARGIRLGDSVVVLVEGSRHELTVVGLALSPEYVFAIAPGSAMPEPGGFGVLFMLEDALAAAVEMEGAFNDATFRLQPGANERAVLAAVDAVLEPYGSVGAVGRGEQSSSYFLNEEIGQLEQFATVLPLIFLFVAAFLLNVVLARLVHLQRPEIAALKALGYSDVSIGSHFMKLVLIIVLVGIAMGVAFGWWAGSAMIDLYRAFFHFPDMAHRLDARTLLEGVVISSLAAFAGAALAVRGVVRLPPAEAMRPPAPAVYRSGLVERLGLLRPLSPAGRMVARELVRRPLRTLVSAFGIALAVAIMVAGRFGMDAFEHLIVQVFQREMTEDLSVTFARPLPIAALGELAHLDGVHRAEGLRVVPVRYAVGTRHRDAILFAFPDDVRLRRLMDVDGRDVALPEDGLLLGRALADILHVSVGDRVRVLVREGDRRELDVPVAALIDDMYGLSGYVRQDVAARWLGEEPRVSFALLSVDPTHMGPVRARLAEMPSVSGVNERARMIASVRGQTGQTWTVMALILTLFAATIAVGVVYNNARIVLSVRARDLASLRVLGFTRREISTVLLSELSVQILLAIPLGLWLGTVLAEGVMSTMDPERYRMPMTISATTYAFAVTVTTVAGLLSALLVRRRLDRLDLIAVLKTRE